MAAVDRATSAGPASVGATDPQTLLAERFGLQQFRPGQRRVIDALLAGRSAAAVFPTGGGKSLCYQLPALMLPGTTIIVSPLIALMKDQVDQLTRRGIPAVRLDSSLSATEFRQCMQSVRSGETQILYVAPERFFNERFRASLDSLHVSLFAIDEAHCISQWGHNFRPDYLKLADVAERIGAERILALTATATPPVLDDITAAFDIAPGDAVRTPFFRPNLQLRSSVVSTGRQFSSLLERIEQRERGPTLVYVSLQKTAEQIAESLSAAGLPARAYHAGLPEEERTEIQQWFLESSDGIVAATIAFGMGIDKPDIRYVYHYNPPKSLESYAQEIGRAGRDGKDATCELLLLPQDRIVLDNFVYGDRPAREAVRTFVELIRGQPEEFHISHYRLSSDSDIRILVLRTLLTYLELDGWIAGTSPRYDSYRFIPRLTSQAILDRFEGERRTFIAGVLAGAVRAKKWFTINVTATARRLKEPREKVIRALDYLAEQGCLDLEAKELMHGYRKLREITDAKKLADTLYEQIVAREAAEIARIDRVIDFARAQSCLADQLSTYFGEPLEKGCGICSACRGEGDHPVPTLEHRDIGTSARSSIRQLAKEYPDLVASSHQQARVLCGLSSPALIRARITRQPVYGVCQHMPLAEVLRQLEK